MSRQQLNAQPVPPPPVAPNEAACLQIYVIFTTSSETAAAIRATKAMADGLRAQISVLVASEVPFPLPLDEPPIPVAFTEGRVREAVVHGDVPARVEILLCRDRLTAIRETLPARSLVIVGGRRRWYRHGPNKIARILKQDGHRVISVEDNKKL